MVMMHDQQTMTTPTVNTHNPCSSNIPIQEESAGPHILQQSTLVGIFTILPLLITLITYAKITFFHQKTVTQRPHMQKEDGKVKEIKFQVKFSQLQIHSLTALPVRNKAEENLSVVRMASTIKTVSETVSTTEATKAETSKPQRTSQPNIRQHVIGFTMSRDDDAGTQTNPPNYVTTDTPRTRVLPRRQIGEQQHYTTKKSFVKDSTNRNQPQRKKTNQTNNPVPKQILPRREQESERRHSDIQLSFAEDLGTQNQQWQRIQIKVLNRKKTTKSKTWILPRREQENKRRHSRIPLSFAKDFANQNKQQQMRQSNTPNQTKNKRPKTRILPRREQESERRHSGIQLSFAEDPGTQNQQRRQSNDTFQQTPRQKSVLGLKGTLVSLAGLVVVALTTWTVFACTDWISRSAKQALLQVVLKPIGGMVVTLAVLIRQNGELKG